MMHDTTRMTIALPTSLLVATDLVVTKGKAKSRNELIARAIQRELALIRRAEIDADLSQMAQDAEYQAEVLQMEVEFASRPMSADSIALAEQVRILSKSRFGDLRGRLSMSVMEKISIALALAMDLPTQEDFDLSQA